ncbi:MAG TPA: hypothetical protein VFE93_09990, partial [Myxococcaceae bacterium]|nr:hypothetical protein [Myxococcaceae bacterium]
GVPGAAFGAALGLLLSGLRSGRSVRDARMVGAALVVLGVGSWAAGLVLPRLLVRAEFRRVSQVSEPELGQELDHPLYGRNVYVLSAVASNPRASGPTLDRIARRSEPALHVKPGDSLFDLLVGETRDLNFSVMQLVARNRNTRADSLERLAASPNRDVLVEVARSPLLSPETILHFAESNDIAIRRGLGANRKAGPEVLDRLSRDPDDGTRRAVAWNPSTPAEVRKRLQSDPDQYVRDGAIQGIRAEATDTPLLIR